MGFGGMGIWQMALLLAIVVLVFGTARFRGAGSDIGSAVQEFRDSMADDPGPKQGT